MTLVVLQRSILRVSSLKSETEAGGTCEGGDGEAADGGGSQRSGPRHGEGGATLSPGGTGALRAGETAHCEDPLGFVSIAGPLRRAANAWP